MKNGTRGNPEKIREYQFKPGKSGNPKGAKKGSRQISSILREYLSTNIVLPKNPLTNQVGEKKTIAEVIAIRIVANAIRGNDKAIDRLLDRVEGRPDQHITGDMSINEDQEQETRRAIADIFGKITKNRASGNSKTSSVDSVRKR